MLANGLSFEKRPTEFDGTKRITSGEQRRLGKSKQDRLRPLPGRRRSSARLIFAATGPSKRLIIQGEK
jgi:hypothetical protein